MPYVTFSDCGEVTALFLQGSPEQTLLPLSDLRVLRFLQASDPELTHALLNASDDAHRILLSSLISLLVRKKILTDHHQPEPEDIAEHQPLMELIDSVETDEEQARRSLAQSDRSMVRIIEDVMDVLLQRGIISLQDLPIGAQHLLEVRQALRAYLADNEEDIEQEEAFTFSI
jgi:hypothetical protein